MSENYPHASREQLIAIIEYKNKELNEVKLEGGKMMCERDKLREENQRLREALEKIACARDPFNGLALVMSDVAINALAQAAEKEGE